MPNGDGTGPLGLGPRTGRGLGDCNKDASPIVRPRFFGRGRGRGGNRGYGRDFGRNTR